MGFHMCPVPKQGFVHEVAQPFHSRSSSGTNHISFSDGQRTWIFPDALSYYIFDCGYHPPEAFVRDIMGPDQGSYSRVQFRGGGIDFRSDEYSDADGGSIGFLSQEDVDRAAESPWLVPEDFIQNLSQKCPELKIHHAFLASDQNRPSFDLGAFE